MKPISYARHRFPPDVIRHAVWLYLRFTLSYRDVEDLLAERGLIVSNEAIRQWVLKFGPVIAKNLRAIRPKAYTQWHLDEMVVSLSGRQMYMWRAIDGEGEVLEILVQARRDKAAAIRDAELPVSRKASSFTLRPLPSFVGQAMPIVIQWVFSLPPLSL
jgi:putative transposase